MAADRIGEQCPECNEFALREYFEVGPWQNADGSWELLAKYSYECKACGGLLTHEWPPIALVTNTTK